MAKTGAERWTATRLAALTRREGVKYEMVGGELFVEPVPDNDHQLICVEIAFWLTTWNRQTRLGYVMIGPGLLLGQYDDVIPDVIWVSRQRMADLEGPERKLHGGQSSWWKCSRRDAPTSGATAR